MSPVGELFVVPLPALVGDRDVANVPSGTTYGVLRAERDLRGISVVAIGNADYSDNPRLPALPGSKKEAVAVGDTTILGKNATEAAFHEQVSKHARWRAVHLACHGIIDLDRPMHSALALTKKAPDDGMLTVTEVFATKVPADLVVLSACQSGRGTIYQGEGIVGLTRAFMYAGAPRVICSLWKVDDDATRALMIEFYRLWKGGKKGKGISAAAALKQAQAFVAGHEEWKHPWYWGAWVLWGLPE